MVLLGGIPVPLAGACLEKEPVAYNSDGPSCMPKDLRRGVSFPVGVAAWI